MDPATAVKFWRAVQIVRMRCLMILRQALVLGLVVSRIMCRRHITLRCSCADSQIALVTSCAAKITPTAKATATTTTLEMIRYMMIAIVRYKFIYELRTDSYIDRKIYESYLYK